MILPKWCLFSQKLLKIVVFAQNSSILAKAAHNKFVFFWPKCVHFEKSCSKLSLQYKSLFWQKLLKIALVLPKITLLWQKLHKIVCLGQNGFTSAKATQNCVFCQNSLISAKTHRPNESKWQTGLKKVTMTNVSKRVKMANRSKNSKWKTGPNTTWQNCPKESIRSIGINESN